MKQKDQVYVGVCGFNLGSILAVVLSWDLSQSIVLAFFHGLLSWFYVIYYILRYSVEL